MTVGHIVSRLRADRGWTVARLAREAGLDQAQIHRLERGERTMTLPSAMKLVGALGLSLAVFDPATAGATTGPDALPQAR